MTSSDNPNLKGVVPQDKWEEYEPNYLGLVNAVCKALTNMGWSPHHTQVITKFFDLDGSGGMYGHGEEEYCWPAVSVQGLELVFGCQQPHNGLKDLTGRTTHLAYFSIVQVPLGALVEQDG